MPPAESLTTPRATDRWGTASPPPRSAQQRLDALDKANVLRARRSRLKRQLRGQPTARGLRAAAAVIADPPEWAATMRVCDLLMACHGVGTVKVERGILRPLQIGPSKTLAGLSVRERYRLCAELTRQAEARSA